MWQGSADSNITRGRLVVDAMNQMGFSAMAIGNH
jgi:2',3'-cyclic-nucleotide 2'-phosphodiesterase (5'-nucleotidase family)